MNAVGGGKNLRSAFSNWDNEDRSLIDASKFSQFNPTGHGVLETITLTGGQNVPLFFFGNYILYGIFVVKIGSNNQPL